MIQVDLSTLLPYAYALAFHLAAIGAAAQVRDPVDRFVLLVVVAVLAIEFVLGGVATLALVVVGGAVLAPFLGAAGHDAWIGVRS